MCGARARARVYACVCVCVCVARARMCVSVFEMCAQVNVALREVLHSHAVGTCLYLLTAHLWAPGWLVAWCCWYFQAQASW